MSDMPSGLSGSSWECLRDDLHGRFHCHSGAAAEPESIALTAPKTARRLLWCLT